MLDQIDLHGARGDAAMVQPAQRHLAAQAALRLGRRNDAADLDPLEGGQASSEGGTTDLGELPTDRVVEVQLAMAGQKLRSGQQYRMKPLGARVVQRLPDEADGWEGIAVAERAGTAHG